MVRSPMQVDDDFRKKIKKIQEKIMRNQGKFESFPKITGDIIKMPEWEIMEKKLLNNIEQIEFKINFDRRKEQ